MSLQYFRIASHERKQGIVRQIIKAYRQKEHGASNSFAHAPNTAKQLLEREPEPDRQRRKEIGYCYSMVMFRSSIQKGEYRSERKRYVRLLRSPMLFFRRESRLLKILAKLPIKTESLTLSPQSVL